MVNDAKSGNIAAEYHRTYIGEADLVGFSDAQALYSLSDRDCAFLLAILGDYTSPIRWDGSPEYLHEMHGNIADALLNPHVATGGLMNGDAHTLQLATTFFTNSLSYVEVVNVPPLSVQTSTGHVMLSVTAKFAGGAMACAFLRSDGTFADEFLIDNPDSTTYLAFTLVDKSPLVGSQTYRLAIRSQAGNIGRVLTQELFNIAAWTVA